MPKSGITSYSVSDGSKTLIFGFAVIILIGTALLSLPAATSNGIPLTWREALFTATSATTVTGLVLFNTAERLSTFGELVVLGLIQAGGVGFVTLSVVLLSLIGRHIDFGNRVLLRQALGALQGRNIVWLAGIVMANTLLIEFIGAVVLFFAWLDEMPPAQAAYYAIFHSISAFCNAGFDLFAGTSDPLLVLSRRDPVVVFTLSTLIVIGTLGIAVVSDVVSWPRTRRLTLHSKLVLPLIIFLTISGILFLLLDEFLFTDALSYLPLDERLLLAFFTVVSSRTAGITFIPLAELGEASQLVIMAWMFIGGAPASMAGGIGLTTVAVVLATLYSNVRGHREVRSFGRTLPIETIAKATAILTVSVGLVFVITLLTLLSNGGDIFPVAFEVVSAFSNTGYSLGITGELSHSAQLLIIFTMFWGRLGPLTLVVALAQRTHISQVSYPEEKIIIG
jgi:trk system potassium uptake protein TrkH